MILLVSGHVATKMQLMLARLARRWNIKVLNGQMKKQRSTFMINLNDQTSIFLYLEKWNIMGSTVECSEKLKSILRRIQRKSKKSNGENPYQQMKFDEWKEKIRR